MALTHEPLGRPGGPGLWGMKHEQLPAYIQHIAQDLIRERAMSESHAIATAVAICKKWAAGGKDVHPDTRAKAAAAVAEWEKLRAEAKVTRSEPMTTMTRAGAPASQQDADGLDASWDGDLADLPDLTGLTTGHFDAADSGDGGKVSRVSALPLGTGARFKALTGKLAAKGAADPGALAAWIGRKKYGREKFKALASAARKAHGGGRVSRFTLMRPYPLEECRILRASDGQEYASGRVVEGYATVFDYPVKIRDGQGTYEEVIDRSAFDQTLARIRRSRGGLAGAVRVLYNHGKTMEGMPAPEFQRPLGKPLEVRPDGRGLLTRTEYNTTPLAEEILENIRAGSITAQSFEGPDIQSTPPLRGPGDKYRARNGVLPTVRRMVLGLLNYGPALFAANDGAEFLGVVRMSIPGFDDESPDLPEDEEYSPGTEGDVTGGTPEEVHPSRSHAHRLWQMNTEDLCRQAGIVLKEK